MHTVRDGVRSDYLETDGGRIFDVLSRPNVDDEVPHYYY